MRKRERRERIEREIEREMIRDWIPPYQSQQPVYNKRQNALFIVDRRAERTESEEDFRGRVHSVLNTFSLPVLNQSWWKNTPYTMFSVNFNTTMVILIDKF